MQDLYWAKTEFKKKKNTPDSWVPPKMRDKAHLPQTPFVTRMSSRAMSPRKLVPRIPSKTML